MINQEFYELMDRFEASTLQRLKLTTAEYTVELDRRSMVSAAAPAAVSAPAPAPAAAPAAAPATAKEEGPAITAPLVGTFYSAPAPDAAPFVKAGDKVSKGQTVCLIEAMKMMSEIPAPCDCIIEQVLKTDGELAAFGEALFRCRAV